MKSWRMGNMSFDYKRPVCLRAIFKWYLQDGRHVKKLSTAFLRILEVKEEIEMAYKDSYEFVKTSSRNH